MWQLFVGQYCCHDVGHMGTIFVTCGLPDISLPDLRLMHIQCIRQNICGCCNHIVINMYVAVNTIQATARLLCTLLNGNLIQTFYKLNIHAGIMLITLVGS